MVSREHILDEIRRTAKENGGKPLGQERFSHKTGIKKSDWAGRYWARWGDGLTEAGFSPNKLQGAYDDNYLLEKLVLWIKDNKRFPVANELKIEARQNKQFPSHTTFSRLGNKKQLIEKLVKFCNERPEYNDILAFLPTSKEDNTDRPSFKEEKIEFGSVYLLKSGKYYKIGKTNSVGRRERELAIQLPEKAKIVHEIKTDDPSGIESYWHKRFEDRRKNGEWFDLAPEDIAAFKRRKFM